MKQLTTKTQIFYGLGVSYAIVDQIFAQWILYFYLPPASAGLPIIMPALYISYALAISRFVDMVTDPLVGFLSDKLNTRFGRRIPLIAFGSIPLALSTLAFFFPPRENPSTAFFYLAIVGSLFFTFYTIVGAPYNAMIPEIGRNQTERLNLSTWQSVFRLVYTAFAMIVPGILIKAFGKGDTLLGIRAMVAFLCLIVVLGLAVTVFFVKEKEYSTGEISKENFRNTIGIILKEKNFFYYLFGLLFFFIGFNNLRAVVNYYVEDIMGMGKAEITLASALLFGVAALFFLPTNQYSKKYGYRKVMLSCLVLMGIFTGNFYFLGKILPVKLGFLLFALLGIPIAGAAFIFPPAMLSEIANHISERSGSRIEGLCFGIQGFFLKLAFLLSILILPLVLTMGGRVVQKAGIYNASVLSLVFFACSFFCYYCYREE
ncbi:MFS transporter [Fusobacterium necrophorum]|uniref:MFS transporter n=1 Tax=Fusobacterium necrophorum TaxID=859 RepID=UPI000480CF24|nr:MFS transporter [Fusobacterium necrophorum]